MAVIEVERIESDGLSRQVWRFHSMSGYGSGPTFLRVEYYGREARATKRHKWVIAQGTRYTSFDDRPYNSGIKPEDVPLPGDIAEEALSRFVQSVVVCGPLGGKW